MTKVLAWSAERPWEGRPFRSSIAGMATDVTPQRGKLRVYLGAAPGVGKTYAMLAEAQRRRARGHDVVAAIVVTHGRPLTAAMAEGMESVPLRAITYRGSTCPHSLFPAG
jgi:two-component system, OmpR family, sensor histidine kinase KdpD